MATAYKRVARDTANTQIDWNEVGSNLTNVLKEENRVREETRTAIDDASREYTKRLNDVPQGQNTDLNTFAIDGANKLIEQKLIMTALLKSGEMKPKQYSLMNQNLVDGTDQAFSLFENYNAEWETKMAMNNSGLPVGEQGSSMQNWLMETVEGFGNFGDREGQSSMVINPLTGIVSMAKMITNPSNANGPLVPDMENLESVQVLENRIKQKITKFDVMAASEGFNEMVGEQKVVMQNLGNTYKKGIFKTISDARAKGGGRWEGMSADEKQAQLDGVNAARKAAGEIPITLADFSSITLFQESQNNYIQSQLQGNTLAGSSVLLDFKNTNPNTGEEYYEAMNTPANIIKAKTDPNMILFENKQGSIFPLLTDEQKKVSEEVLRAQIDIGVDYVEEVKVQEVFKTPPKTSKDERDASTELKKQETTQKTWNKLKSADPKTRQNLLTSLLGDPRLADDMGLTSIAPSADGTQLLITYIDDKNNVVIDLEKEYTDAEWAALGRELSGLTPEKQLEQGGFKKDANGDELAYKPIWGDVVAGRKGAGIYNAEISQYTSKIFPKTDSTGDPFFTDAKSDEVIPYLEEAYSEFGIIVDKISDDQMSITFDGYDGDPNFPKVFQLEVDPISVLGGENKVASERQSALESWINHVITSVDGKAELVAKSKGFSGQSKKLAKKLNKPPSSVLDTDLYPCVNGTQINKTTGVKYLCR